ncbi:MAG TPA: acyltransferase family protein, partial [Leptolyngbya sp.]|nr:acyltransferase family protein [Leptolyngbya sp.]
MKNLDRRYDLDWLRVLAVLLLIYYHTAAIFYRGDLGTFYVVDSHASSIATLFILFVHQWHMPLFFFLSGSATWFSLEVRTTGEYVKERFQRLLIPFVFGTLTLVPPQVYYHLRQASGDRCSYFQFYPQFFNGIRPAGNFEWAHLWFVIYLFVLSLVALPILGWLRQATETLNALKLERVESMFYLAIPLALIEALFRPRWIGFQNLYDDWANVLLYLSYFIYGYVFFVNQQLWQSVDRQKPLIFAAAIGGMSILFGLWITDTVPLRSYSLAYMAYQGFRGVNSWCWVLALLSVARSYLNAPHRLLKYASEASYPFYLLHQSIVVAVGFYVVQWQIGMPQKFMIISTMALGGTI